MRFLVTSMCGVLLLCTAMASVAPAAPTAAAPVVAANPPSAQSGDTLYKRLGGYDSIAALSDDFIGRLTTDQKLSRFFVGFSEDSKKRIRQLFVDLVCAATGGPCIYLGRDIKTVHQGLHITESDWQAAGVDLTQSFDKFNVGQRERNDVLQLLLKLKPDIVGH